MGSYRLDSNYFMHGPDPPIKQHARSSTIMYFQNTEFNCKYYEKLDHIPSSCIVLMDASTLITEMESETDSQPRQWQVSMLQSQEMNSTVQYSFRTLDRSWHHAIAYHMHDDIYSTRLALFIHGITSTKKMHEVGQQYLSEKVALSF